MNSVNFKVVFTNLIKIIIVMITILTLPRLVIVAKRQFFTTWNVFVITEISNKESVFVNFTSEWGFYDHLTGDWST